MAFDRKYGKVITQFGTIGEDEPVVVFRARDETLPDLLVKAIELAKRAGSPQRHIDILTNTLSTIVSWQGKNQELVRIPASESSKDRLPK